MLTYKDGKTAPQKNDEVMGDVGGKPARGRVLAVREKTVLVTRRAAYAGAGQPLAAEHAELDPATLSLVYRPRGSAPAPAVRGDAAQAKPRAAAADAKASKAAAKKEAAAK